MTSESEELKKLNRDGKECDTEAKPIQKDQWGSDIGLIRVLL